LSETVVYREEKQPTILETLLQGKPPHVIIAFVAASLSIALSLYHLFIAYAGTVEAHAFRSTHLAFILVITFLIKPLGRKSWREPYRWYSFIDFLLLAAVIIIQIYTLYDIEAFIFRRGDLTNWDLWMGTVMIIILLEATRRTVGWAMVIISAFFLAHTALSNHFFWIFYGPPNSWYTIVDYLFMRENGIYGIPLMVMATYIFLFILFGAILMESGAGRFFINLALALTGSRRGGPAKASIVSSALMATVSGSAVANVVTTGTFTIPLMKRIGYRPRFAAAVEACSSSGGQIMPPVMGAAAFIIAEFLSMPYLKVCVAAFFPAILYFFSIFIMVHFEAAKRDLAMLKKADLPNAKAELKRGGHLFISLAIIIGLLVIGYTPMYAAFWAIVSVLVLSFMKKETRMSPERLLCALEDGATKALPVSIACACAGIIIGSVFVSGLGLKFTNLIVTISAGRLWLALFLTMIASLVLGMGLTTTAVYITVAALVIPALVKMGVVPIAAHFFAFYFGLVSAITPPVALAAFAAAGIAGSNPMETGFSSFRLGIAKYILPFVFVYGPGLVFVGPWYGIVRSVAATTLGLFALTVVTEGWMYDRVSPILRILMIIPSILLFFPHMSYNLVGVGVFMGILLYLRKKHLTLVKIT
jgi:TRAP transporter 4TM/12TM fusion protein